MSGNQRRIGASQIPGPLTDAHDRNSFHEGLGAELVTIYKAPRIRTVLVNLAYTRTSLFQGFGVSSKAFFAPALEIDTVAQEIVEQVLSGESGQLTLPGFHKLMGIHFRSLPHWVSHPGRIGASELMSAWNGRQVNVDG